MKLGFTGTRDGLTFKQTEALWDGIKMRRPSQFHHGACRGGDKTFDDLAKRIVEVTGFQAWIVLHPATDASQQAVFEAQEIREAKPYLERNQDIVHESDFLIACPKEFTEQFKGSGTWATIRYARKLNKPGMIIYPDGEKLWFLKQKEY